MRTALIISALTLTSCKNPLVVKEYLNLISLSPTQGATQVAVDTNIVAGFSEALVPSSIDSQTAYLLDEDGAPVIATASYEAGAHWIVIDPEADLRPNMTYVVTYTSGIMGKNSGPLLAPVQTTFSTAGVNPANSLPTAQAGADQEVGVGATVVVDGSSSSDLDDALLTYSWRMVGAPANSTASLSTTTGPVTEFITDAEGEYIVGLVVNDGVQDSSEDFVIVRALGEAPPPEDTGGSAEDTGSTDDEDPPGDTGDTSDTGAKSD